jgi:hypothetical protein
MQILADENSPPMTVDFRPHDFRDEFIAASLKDYLVLDVD